MRVEVLDEAEQDLVDGAHFYEAQEPDLGQYFLDSLFSDVDSLQLYAGIHPLHFGHHRLLSKRFPYNPVVETREICENIDPGLDQQENLVSMAIEHARSNARLDEFS